MDLVVCIDVDDIERGIDFYTRGVALRLGRRFAPDWVELLGAPAPIFLQHYPAGSIPSPGARARRDYARHWTPVHLDFVVPDVDDKTAVRVWLRDMVYNSVRNQQMAEEANMHMQTR